MTVEVSRGGPRQLFAHRTGDTWGVPTARGRFMTTLSPQAKVANVECEVRAGRAD